MCSRIWFGGLTAALFVTGLIAPESYSGAADESVPGRVTEVTLYDGQALVTRAIPVEGAQGGVEIVVGDLPEQILPDSLFAEGIEQIEVRAVRFRSRAVGQAPREEVRVLDEAIEDLNAKIESNQRRVELLNKRSEYLDSLEGFVAPTAKLELSKGVLDSDALQQVTLFSFEQRESVATDLESAENEAKQLQKQLLLAQRKRSELTDGASQTVREAVLFLEKHVEGPQPIRLNYLVSNCGWSPSYTFRATADNQQVQVEFNALIHQMTGEDWAGVTLTLSTASPALSSSGPGLAPFPVTLTEEVGDGKISGRELAAQLQAVRDRQYEANVRNRSAANISEIIGSSWAVNAAANDFQTLELISGKDIVNTLEAEEIGVTEGHSLSYQLGGTVSLASRSDQQMVRVLRTEYEGLFYNVATPVLTGYVYREAELINTGGEDLLKGPINVYLDGRFVGRGEIPTVARGQKFVVGFGADPQLRSRRELVSKTESTQGGNRELKFQYRLVVENYKDQVVPVRVFDRLPYCDRPGDVRVTLADLEDALDDDMLYQRRERPKGILRWTIDVPAHAILEQARIILYGFTVEHDRSFQLATVGGGSQLQREFEELQRARIAPSAAEDAFAEPPAPMPAEP
jgi:uncharacterized protein (TIGR02231 family)